MKQIFIILFATIYTIHATLFDDKQKWINFKTQHKRAYSSSKEEQLRFSIFQQNLRTIENHNRLYEVGETTYFMGVNQFADFTQEEYFATLKRQAMTKPRYNRPYADLDDISLLKSDLPNATDWRDVGAVSRVKAQGSCGSCWAFSVTGTLEGFWFNKHKEMVEFSEQQLVDCDKSNTGCAGGEEAPAMEYFTKYGIQTEDSYQYAGITQECAYNESAVYAKLESYTPIEPGDEHTVLQVVGSLGPCSVALDASGLPFYQGGVFTSTSCSNTTTNHAVLAVGYGRDETLGLDYWIIKNSWGENWGENGYFKIKRGSNECAIAMDSVYPSFG